MMCLVDHRAVLGSGPGQIEEPREIHWLHHVAVQARLITRNPIAIFDGGAQRIHLSAGA